MPIPQKIFLHESIIGLIRVGILLSPKWHNISGRHDTFNADRNCLEFREFGIFEPKQRKARKAQNPKTLEKVSVPQRTTVKFKPGRLMKKNINENNN